MFAKEELNYIMRDNMRIIFIKVLGLYITSTMMRISIVENYYMEYMSGH